MAELSDSAAQKAVEDKCAEFRDVLSELGYDDDDVRQKIETFRHFLCVKMSICERLRHESQSCRASSQQSTELALQETPPASDCSEGGEAVVDCPLAPSLGENEATARKVDAVAVDVSSDLRIANGCDGAANVAEGGRSENKDTHGTEGCIASSHVVHGGLNDIEHVDSESTSDSLRLPVESTLQASVALESAVTEKRPLELSSLRDVTRERSRKRKKRRQEDERIKRAAAVSSNSDSSESRSRSTSPRRRHRRKSRHHNHRRRRPHRSRHRRRRHDSRSRSRSRSASRRRSASRSRTFRCSSSRSPSIRRRMGSPTHLDRRRITSARKRPVPYVRVPTPPSSTDSSPVRHGRVGRLRQSPPLVRRTRSSS